MFRDLLLRERLPPDYRVLRLARGLERSVQACVLHRVMHENILTNAARLSDEALLAHVASLARRERDATVELIGHLAELDGRKIHLGEGSASLYKYCRDVLGYSEDAAWNRAATANVVRRYPFVLGWLADGSLNVTTVRILRRVLTAENHLAVLTEARHRSKKEVELIEARLNPRPDVPSSIRKVSGPAPTETAVTLTLLGSSGSGVDCRPAPIVPARDTLATRSAVEVTRPVTRPLTPERYRLQFTVSKETHDKLRHLQDLLCREIPDGDPAVIFERALDLLVAHVEKKKLAATKSPRPPRENTSGSRDIPAHVHRAVWERDGGQCAFVGSKGRCTERRFLEWHHLQPFGHQGPPTVTNISLRCAAHNAYESELVFGRFELRTARGASGNAADSREIPPFRNGGVAR